MTVLSSISHSAPTFLLIAAFGLVACTAPTAEPTVTGSHLTGSAATEPPPKESDGKAKADSASGAAQSSAGGTSNGGPPASAAPATGADCSGTYNGTIEGMAAGISTKLEEKVHGTADIKIADGTIGKGSGFDMTIDTILGFPMSGTEPILGNSACGKLDGKISANIMSIDVEGEATCTLSPSGCTDGHWEMRRVDSKKVVGTGTFTLKK